MAFVALACLLIAVDGDTLRCGQEVIRLVGIDAPELPGHCREGRDCAPGDPFASKLALEAVSRGTAVIDRQGRDIYDRTLARIRVNGLNLSCAQLASAHAIYRADWDQFGLVRADCGFTPLLETGRPSPRVAAARKRLPPAETTRSGWSYRNCGEARRAGAAPLYRGRPGYGAHIDGDGDGTACEPYRGVTR